MLETKHLADVQEKAQRWAELPRGQRADVLGRLHPPATEAERRALALLDAAGGDYDPHDPLA